MAAATAKKEGEEDVCITQTCQVCRYKFLLSIIIIVSIIIPALSITFETPRLLCPHHTTRHCRSSNCRSSKCRRTMRIEDRQPTPARSMAWLVGRLTPYFWLVSADSVDWQSNVKTMTDIVGPQCRPTITGSVARLLPGLDARNWKNTSSDIIFRGNVERNVEEGPGNITCTVALGASCYLWVACLYSMYEQWRDDRWNCPARCQGLLSFLNNKTFHAIVFSEHHPQHTIIGHNSRKKATK